MNSQVQVVNGSATPFKDRFPNSLGFVHDLKTVIELDKKGEL